MVYVKRQGEKGSNEAHLLVVRRKSVTIHRIHHWASGHLGFYSSVEVSDLTLRQLLSQQKSITPNIEPNARATRVTHEAGTVISSS